MIKILLPLITILLVGCTDTPRSIEGEIDALYWHERDRYTIKTIENGLVSDVHIPPWGGHTINNAVEVFVDVEPHQKSWYKCNWTWNGWLGSDNEYCELHIHDLNEIGTAGWNHGKFGSGSTTRID